MQRVIDGIKHARVTCAQFARRGFVCVQDFAHRVPDPKVGLVHVTRNDENHCDRQVVVSHISEPQGLSLRMESTEEGEDCSPRTRSGVEHLVHSIRVLSVHTPVSSEEGSQTRRVRQRRHEVIPTDVLTTGFRNRNVNEVSSPSERADAE